MCENGDDVIGDPKLMQRRDQKKFPSIPTCIRWISQYRTEGNILPKRASGNHFAMQEVHGEDLVNLALYRVCRPKAYIDEV